MGPASVLAARVALCLALIALPDVLIIAPAARAALRGGAAPTDQPDADPPRSRARAAALATHLITLFASTTPLQAWLETVGEVSHLAGLVVPATALAAGAAVAVASISASPAVLAPASALVAAAFIAGGGFLHTPILASIAATVTVLFMVAGYALTPPAPVGPLALTGLAGLTLGAAVYTAATWAVSPAWATDRALAAAARAAGAAADLQALGGGGEWRFDGGGAGEGGEAGRPPAPPPPPPPRPRRRRLRRLRTPRDPPPVLPAAGELSAPRPPLCLRRREKKAGGGGGRGDEEAGPATPSASSSTFPPPPPPPSTPDEAWARVHVALAEAGRWREAARGEGCAGVVRVVGRKRGSPPLRLLFPLLPALNALLPRRARHFPTEAAEALADATAAHARLAWTMAVLPQAGALAGPAAGAVLATYGERALAGVGEAANAAAAAIAAAVPARYEPVVQEEAGGVAGAELAALDDAVAAIQALHDGAAARVQHEKTNPASLAALMAQAASDDALFLDEIRFAAWQAGLAPLARVLRRAAGAVEELRDAMPKG